MGARAAFERIPMPIEQSVKNDCLYLGIFDFFVLLCIAAPFFSSFTVALRIDIRRKQNVLPIRRPKFATGFSRNCGQLVHSSDISRSAIKVRNPDLRSAILIREEGKAAAIRCPARTVAVLIG